MCHDGSMSHEPDFDARRRITRIIGVYNARGTLWGEVSYLVQRTFAGKHCALCDITHSSVRRRPLWDQQARKFSLEHEIAVELLHLDEVPPQLAQMPEFRAPAVFALRDDNSYALIMEPQDLEHCEDSPEQFFMMLKSKIC